MPIHDWTRIEANIFHCFHLGWTVHLSGSLNQGGLPADYYSLLERPEAELADESDDLLDTEVTPEELLSLYRPLRNTVSIRRVKDHRPVGLIEITSPPIKQNDQTLGEFVNKVRTALQSGVHVVVVDLIPPSPNDVAGIHGAVWATIDGQAQYPPHPGKPLTLASYVAEPKVTAYLDYVAVGDELPDMPLFFSSDQYARLPLGASYAAAFAGMADYWREVVEGRRSHPS